jgi:hypothetical protein
VTRLWPTEEERSPLASAFDEAAMPVNSASLLVVFQRDGESDAELEARARSEKAADKLGRHLCVVRYV